MSLWLYVGAIWSSLFLGYAFSRDWLPLDENDQVLAMILLPFVWLTIFAVAFRN